MRKLLLTLIFALSCTLGMMAQTEGKWQVLQVEPDELKGEPGGSRYVYGVENMGWFIVWDWNKYQFMISSFHPFAAEHVSDMVSSYDGELVLVGIYDENGKMTEKFEMWLDLVRDSGYKDLRTRDSGFMNNPVGQKKKVRKIFEALKSGVGYVRIVAPRYDNSDFDIKILAFRESGQ
jgi:hypothetical protein